MLVARTAAEVPAVLAAVEAATAAGAWAFGHLAYEAAPGLDPTLVTRAPDPEGPPLAWFGVGAAPTAVAAVGAGERAGTYRCGPWSPRVDAAGHHRAVDAVRAAIARGTTYQCNLTTRLEGPVSGDLRALYADLALAQRGSHNAYLDLGRHVVASASPELFLALTEDPDDPGGGDGHLLLRPMKGTAPRGRTRAEDDAAAAALRASSKERAENVMIVDLMRNDAARVARTGSVRVPTLCALERYETVLQLTSDVVARVPATTGLTDLMRALFPCGSVTGAPKASTMRLIAELEDSPRGVYCGAIGWVAPPGQAERARFSVAIRTLVADRVTGRGVYGTGGGITWSSDPAAEWAELGAKAAVLEGLHDPDRPPPDAELLETLALDATGPRHLDRHLARLADSAARLGVPYDDDRVRAAVSATTTAAATVDRAPARLRVRLARDGTVAVDHGPLTLPNPRPVRLAVADDPADAVDHRATWPHHKTTWRTPYDRRRARHPGADDVVLVNDRGELTETTIASLAVLLDGRWWTPPLDAGALPGVGRALALERGALTERVLHPADLARAEALAVVSALRGWRPAVLVDADYARTTVPSSRRSRKK